MSARTLPSKKLHFLARESCPHLLRHRRLTSVSISSLARRAENETRSFSASAILCADGPERVTVNSTMKGIFKAIVKGTQTVSHMCTFAFMLPIFEGRCMGKLTPGHRI